MYLRYVLTSRPATGLTERDLGQILLISRRKNQDARVTGALLFCDDEFTHILEGPEKALEKIKARMCLDDRHGSLDCLASERCATRYFGQWMMAYVTATSDNGSRHTGGTFDVRQSASFFSKGNRRNGYVGDLFMDGIKRIQACNPSVSSRMPLGCYGNA